MVAFWHCPCTKSKIYYPSERGIDIYHEMVWFL